MIKGASIGALNCFQEPVPASHTWSGFPTLRHLFLSALAKQALIWSVSVTSAPGRAVAAGLIKAPECALAGSATAIVTANSLSCCFIDPLLFC